MTRDFVPEFAARLKAARLARGWSQAELARQAGTSQPNIARIEDGSRAPSLRLADRLAGALGLLVSDLLPHRSRARDYRTLVTTETPPESSPPTPPD